MPARSGCTSFSAASCFNLGNHLPSPLLRSYKDGKFQGHVWKFKESQPNFEDLGCNDKVSSLRVGPGTTVILFNDKKYGGSSIEINADASTLGKFNDKSSSMKVLKECGPLPSFRTITGDFFHSVLQETLANSSLRAPHPHDPHPGEVYAYRDGNFESYVWRIKESCPDVSKIGAKGAISSIKLAPGTECLLYNEANYKGKCVTVSHSQPGLKDFNDKVLVQQTHSCIKTRRPCPSRFSRLPKHMYQCSAQ